MRELKSNEMNAVTGADCSSGGGNNYGGVTSSGLEGPDLRDAYEFLVAATSRLIERIANAL